MPIEPQMMTMSSNDRLEPEFKEPYEAWKSNPGPETNSAMLKALNPVIQKGVYANVGPGSHPLMTSRARQITLDSLGRYDRSRSQLQTHLMNQYRGLRRADRQSTEVLRAPERLLLDRNKLQEYEQELEDELGRPPTDNEIANRTGFSAKRMAKIRNWKPGAAEGQFERADANLLSSMGVGPSAEARNLWVEMVYDDMPPIDQAIMEHTLGLNGKRVLSNAELARKLGRTPGAISQRKQRIQQALNEEAELSPFLE